MTEILTESFCERCGTRYTFESSAPRKSRLGRVRTLSKGVRNFVLSDDSSFSEAMADARSEEELAATTHQLDAFHKTFNFCLTCRQYTCGECWNVPDGRCLTCAPMPGQDEPVRIDVAALPPIVDAEMNGHYHEDVDAWPELDLPADRLARVLEPSNGTAAFLAAETLDEAPVDDEAAWPEMEVPQLAAMAPVKDTDKVAEAEAVDEDAPIAAAAGGNVESAVEPVAAAEPTVAEAAGIEAPEVEAPAAAIASPEVEAPAAAIAANQPEVADEGHPVLDAAAMAAAADALADEEEVEPQLRGMTAGQSLDEAIAAYEARLAEEEAGQPAAAAAMPEGEPVESPAVPDVEPVAAQPFESADGLEIDPDVAAAAVAAGLTRAATTPDVPAADEEEHRIDARTILGAAAAIGLTHGAVDQPEHEHRHADHDHEVAAGAAAAHVADDIATAEPELTAESEPVAAQPEPEPEPVAAAEAEPVAAAAEAEPEPEPIAVEPEPEPVAAAEAEPEPAAVRDDVVPQPTWPIAAEAPAAEAPAPAQPATPAASPWLTVAPDDGVAPQWPASPPSWPAPNARREAPTTLAGRPLLPPTQGDVAALWAASAREVLAAPVATPSNAAAPTAQPCVSCGLSLSANARFCRRCGTRQG